MLYDYYIIIVTLISHTIKVSINLVIVILFHSWGTSFILDKRPEDRSTIRLEIYISFISKTII